jgi:hypothetical protein
VPVDATVTAHDVPEVEKQEVPLVTSCISLIVAWAAKQNSRLRRAAFMPVRPRCMYCRLPGVRRKSRETTCPPSRWTSTGIVVIAGTRDQKIGSERRFISSLLSAGALWIPPTFWLYMIHTTFVGSQACTKPRQLLGVAGRRVGSVKCQRRVI